MAMRYAIGFLLAFVIGVAYSQQPSPTPPVGGQDKQDQKPASDNKPADPPQGTKQNPIFIKSIETEESTERRTNKAKDRQEKTTAERWMLITNIVVALVGGVAAIIAGVAAKAAYIQAKSIKRSERARIFIEVKLEKIDREEVHGDVPMVKITATNHGKTVATITRIRSYLLASDTIPSALPSPHQDEKSIPDGFGIAPNLSYGFGARYQWETLKPDNKLNLDISWYCVGEFHYGDIFGDHHITGFCWDCMPKNSAAGFSFCVDSALNYQT